MKSGTLVFITAMTFLIAVAITVQGQQGDIRVHARYRVFDIGTLGGTFGQAFSINNEGWVVGYATTGGDLFLHAFLWRNGVMTDLGTLGGPISQGIRINERGEVVGAADNSITDPLGEEFCFSMFGDGNECLPFVWQNGVTTVLGILGGGDNGVALGINKKGTVVGQVENKIHDTTCPAPQVLRYKPVVWEEGVVKTLPTLPGLPDGVAAAINDGGQVVGVSGNCSGSVNHSVLWDHGTRTDLGNLGGTTGGPTGINNEGQVVGSVDLPGGTFFRAFLWQKGVMTNLGTLPKDVLSFGNAINDKGEVVGQSCRTTDFSNCSVFLWQRGEMTNLNSVIHGSSPLHLFDAGDINSRGEIVGLAIHKTTGQLRAFLAIPCGNEHSDAEGCEDAVQDATVAPDPTSEVPNVALSEDVRKMLRHRLGFGRFAGSLPNVALNDTVLVSQPNATLSPTSLIFPTKAIGTVSAPKTVNLKNTGTASLTISNIAINGTNAGDFAQNHTCGSSLAAGASCTISVTFKPTASGTRTAALSITDNASGSPQKVMLSGVGTTAKISTTSLSFGSVFIGKTGPAKAATLTNVGTTTLTISSIAITGTNAGDFAQTHTCGSSLAAGASCSISLTFKPTASGTQTASLSITDNAHGSPQTVSLTGRGTLVELNPPSLNFGSVTVGQSSSQTTTLTNAENTQLHITTITITGTEAGDFSQQNNCPDPGDLGGGKSCAITVTFQPTQVGTRSAFVSVSDDGGGSPDQVSLSGTGQQSSRCSGACGGPTCHRDCGCINGICVGSGLSGISGNLDMLWRKETASELLCTRRPAIAFACQE
jgi:probable HAF family extracellular repeat protein